MLTWLGNNTSQSDKQIFSDFWYKMSGKSLLPSLISVVTRSSQHITAPVGKHYYRNVVEGHCYVVKYSRIDHEQWCSRINQQLIAGHFGHIGLCQLHAKLFCMQLTKAYMAETPCNQLIDWFCYVIAHNLFAYITTEAYSHALLTTRFRAHH